MNNIAIVFYIELFFTKSEERGESNYENYI